MSLVVEDGTGKPDAESYISVADTDTRLAKLGYTIWAELVTEEKEQALRRATNYMMQAYGARWLGSKKTTDQALDWPRTDVIDRNGLEYPDNIVLPIVANACADLAFRAASGELLQDQGQTVIKEKVHNAVEVEYAKGSTATVRYIAVDLMLRPVLGNFGMAGIMLERR